MRHPLHHNRQLCRPLLLLALGFLPLSTANAQFFGNSQKPVPQGAQFSLEPTKTTYFLGENIVVHFCLTNTSKTPFQIEVGGDYRGAPRYLRFKITATDSAGVAAKDPYPNPLCFGGIGVSPTLKPGEKWYQTLSLNRYCRFEKAGVYTVSGQHDMGWKATPENPLPVGQTQITLKEPTPAEAKSLIIAVEALPPDAGITIGSKTTTPMTDFSTFSYPVYLPYLVERVQAGKLGFLESISGIQTPEATHSLVELLKAKPQTAQAAAEVLLRRLPNIRQLPLEQQETEQAPPPWPTDLTAPTCEYASQLILSDNRESLRTAGTLLMGVGNSSHLPFVLKTLDKRLQATLKTPRWVPGSKVPDNQEGWQLQDDCETLMRCAAAIVKRGARLPASSSPAVIATRLQLIEGTEAQGRWTPNQQKWLQHPLPFIRQLTLESLQTPYRPPSKSATPPKKFVLAPALRAILPKLLDDPDVSVQAAACNLAAESRDHTLLPYVLPIVATARNEWLISSANGAAQSMGGRYQMWEIWANRLDEKDMLRPAIEALSQVVKNRGGYGWDSNTNADTAKRLKVKWLQFLKVHHARLQMGQLFTSQEIKAFPGLFPKAFTMYP